MKYVLDKDIETLYRRALVFSVNTDDSLERINKTVEIGNPFFDYEIMNTVIPIINIESCRATNCSNISIKEYTRLITSFSKLLEESEYMPAVLKNAIKNTQSDCYKSFDKEVLDSTVYQLQSYIDSKTELTQDDINTIQKYVNAFNSYYKYISDDYAKYGANNAISFSVEDGISVWTDSLNYETPIMKK